MFGTPKLTDFISKAHRELGYEGGGTNLFRKIAKSISNTTEKGQSSRGQFELAKKLKHSVSASENYKRKVKED